MRWMWCSSGSGGAAVARARNTSSGGVADDQRRVFPCPRRVVAGSGHRAMSWATERCRHRQATYSEASRRKVCEGRNGAPTMFSNRFNKNLFENIVGTNFYLDQLEREQLLVVLHRLVLELAPDEALDVEDSLLRVESGLVLGTFADEAVAGVVPRQVGRVIRLPWSFTMISTRPFL